MLCCLHLFLVLETNSIKVIFLLLLHFKASNTHTANNLKADLVFILDSSDMMGFKNFQAVKEAVKHIIMHLPVDHDEVSGGKVVKVKWRERRE